MNVQTLGNQLFVGGKCANIGQKMCTSTIGGGKCANIGLTAQKLGIQHFYERVQKCANHLGREMTKNWAENVRATFFKRGVECFNIGHE